MFSKKNILGFLTGLAITLVVAVPAFGNVSAFTAASGLSFTGGGPVNLGLSFTVNDTITVDALGFYDIAPSDNSSTPVAIYTSSGTLLASTNVPSSAGQVDGYLFQSISPITLTAGDSYVVDELTANGNWDYGGAGPPPTPAKHHLYWPILPIYRQLTIPS